MDKVIIVDGLSKDYPLNKGKKTLSALKGISFNVYKGEIFGILGPNGAGKTTTLEIIECLKSQTSGRVTVLGFDNLEAPDDIKKRIGVQLQSSQYLHHLSLGELLDLFASFYPKDVSSRVQPRDPLNFDGQGIPRSEALLRNDTQGLLRLVGLEEKESEEFANLSGGQKQRFTIATSLVHEPKILFLDEPTTGLDPKARRDMWQLIKKINADGITTVLTTHYMEEAEFLCHRVAIMDQGKILEIDEPKKLIDRLSDTTQISFFTDKQIDQGIFKSIAEIKKVHADFPKVVLEITSLDKISAVVNLLKRQNVIFYGFTVKTATLEDVYLDLTGKEYEE
jgi:ABC-2 type transport system ATP-binding protein